ncbi:hypothetical protein JOQ06_024104 [Pogonophryne albipinna]|uniref:ZMYM2-like/QRICH1 C-terminal domain-containing protein n=1 Tax=Pogonophryne albipinna TaxID=1090488 RepID=A0AAD6BPC9_9TELE|nr:hypothetical protein JOQ06_024104 [Pogonophryne albipinna]
MVDFGTVSKPELNSLLRQFYGSVRNTKGQQYAISTYVGLRAAVNRFINDPPYSRAWCLMKDNEFTTSNNVFSGLIKSLRRAGQDKTEHHPAITNEDLEILRKSRAMDPNTPRGLLNKVIIIIIIATLLIYFYLLEIVFTVDISYITLQVWFDTQLHFGRRGKEGLRKLTPQSFVVKRDSAGTKYVTMAFNEETKNHKCHNDRERQNMRGAMFEEPGNALCPVASFEAYLSTLPESAKAFYHHPRKSVKPGDAVWYSMEPLGVNSLGSMMTRISWQTLRSPQQICIDESMIWDCGGYRRKGFRLKPLHSQPVPSVVDKLYTFIANSTKRHAAFVETQKAINPGQRPLELQKLSETRWNCRENALKTIRKVLPAAMQYLEDLRKCECRRSEICMKATTAAEALDIEIPEQIPGQGRRWKVPEKFKYSSTSANEDHHVLTLEEYWGKLYFTFLYILRQELERRFRGEGKNSSDILRSLYSLTDPAQWKNIDQGLNTVHSLCEFYGFQGEEIHLKTELRVFHATYTCPERTAKAMLDVFK